MIYITGDTHGKPIRLTTESMPFSAGWSAKDTLIVCGDFGYLMNGTPREELFLRELSFRPYTICFVDGNRDNHSMLGEMPVTEWNGGKVHRMRKNLLHLMRGQVYTIGGQRVFTMGGGYSVDRARRFEGVDWWPEELPSHEEYTEGLRNLKKADMRVDTVITHTAPLSVLGGLYPMCAEERPLNEYLDRVKSEVSFKRWYFGHLHLDAALDDGMYAMFMSVREMETGEIVW